MNAQLNRLAEFWLAWMAPMAWQVTVLFLALSLITWLLRNQSARTRYAIWMLVPIRLVLPPTFAFVTGWGWWLLPPTHDATFAAAAAADSQPINQARAGYLASARSTDRQNNRNAMRQADELTARESPSRSSADRLAEGRTAPAGLSIDGPSPNVSRAEADAASTLTWKAWLMSAWGGGVMSLCMVLLWGAWRVKLMVRRAKKLDSGPLFEAAERCRRHLGFRARVEVREAELGSVPMLVGILRKSILLPSGIQERLTERELEAVLIHELQHAARRDALVNFMQKLLLTCYFFHPLIWLADWVVCRLREDACDEATLASLHGVRADYGSAILKVAELSAPRTPRLALGIVESGQNLKRRITRILDADLPIGRRLPQVAAVAVLLLGAFLLPASARPQANVDEAVQESGNRDSNQKEQPQVTGAKEPNGNTTSNSHFEFRGRIVGAEGKLATGAYVAIVGRKATSARGGPSRDVLAESTSDQFGAYGLSVPKSAAKTHNAFSLMARTDSAAIWWTTVDLKDTTTEIDLELKAQQPLKIQLIDLEGQPAPNVALNVARVISWDDRNDWRSPLNLHSLAQRPEAAIPPLVADESGHVTVPNLAADDGVFLSVAGDRRFAPQTLILNSRLLETRRTKDRLYQPLIRSASDDNEFIIPLAAAQRFRGSIQLGNGESVAANAHISVWSSQQEVAGSYVSVESKTDSRGHFDLNPKPGIRFHILAYPPNGSPFLARRTEDFRWDSESSQNLVINLPKGAIVRGQVVDSETANPIAHATVQYFPNRSRNENLTPGLLSSWENHELTSESGDFTIAVPPGPGTLLVHAPTSEYVLQEIRSEKLSWGRSGGVRMYAHAIEPIVADTAVPNQPLSIKLQPGASVSGTITDPQGRPVKNALMLSRLKISPLATSWRGTPTQVADGRFRVSGLAKGKSYRVYFLDPAKRLGATAVVRVSDPSPQVELEPCASAKLKFVDPNGDPISGARSSLYLVVSPGERNRMGGRSGKQIVEEELVRNIDRVNYRPRPESDDNGELVLPGLIPGARYRYYGSKPDDVMEFVAESGVVHDLRTIVSSSSK